ncbi:signal peptidase I [uncultured Microbacterium sp.]|uniref:signal peptidase I n=1 Tax=uncultured Microbacterium sp. TaxID=191216 RepID=UPI003748CED7
MPEPSPRTHRVLSSIRWVLVGLLLAAMLAPAVYSALTQTQFVSIEGASMAPTYEIGDLVVMAPPTPADFTPGHVVTVRSSDGSLYTHRIVSIDDAQATLKGDGNTSPDPHSVPFSDVVGAVVGHISQPWATPMALLLQWPVRIFVALFIIGLVVLPLGTSRETAHNDASPPGEIDAEPDTPRDRIDDEEARFGLDDLERFARPPAPGFPINPSPIDQERS